MFLLEGNIGAGKTTLLKKIKEEIPFLNVIFEPVNQWHNGIAGKSLLSDFYKDSKRWAYTLETFAMTCRIREYLKESINTSNKIMERSIFSGHYCFAKNDFINGYMTKLEWEIYKNWFSFLVSNKVPMPAGFIYLKTDPEVSLERIKKRARTGEQKITLDYLKDLDKRHKEFLIDKTDISAELKKVPILSLDCNFDFETNKNHLAKLSDDIKDFANQTTKNYTANVMVI